MTGKEDTLRIDIIIPVYKPDDKLKRLFRGIASQTVKPDNIIVMYTKSSPDDHFAPDYIEEGMKAAGDLKVYEIERNEFDHGGTRAAAVSLSHSSVFIMMTMDAVPADEHFIERLIAIFDKDMYVGAAYGRQLPDDSSSLAERFTRGFNYPATPVLKSKEDIDRLGIKTFFCSNVCAAYSRDIYNKLGGFIDRTIFNEDMIFAHKVIMNGYKIYYAADAGVIHSHDYTPMQQFHRNFDLAVSQAMHPEVFEGVSSESEGARYIKSAYRYFKDAGKGYMIVPFVWGCCFRYAGYLLGKRYDKLPMKLVKACAMNKGFFGERENVRSK